MNNYKKHFDRELKIMEAGLKEGDNLAIKDFIPEIESIMEKFSKQGYSGGSAPFYSGSLGSTIKKVLSFQPLSPITGEDNEWVDVAETMGEQKKEIFQNNRLSALFKDGKDGKPYYIDAIVWSGEEEHDTFIGGVENINSRQFVRLPFTPKTFYIDVVKHHDIENYNQKDVVEGDGKYVYKIKDRKQLEAVFEYYDKE